MGTTDKSRIGGPEHVCGMLCDGQDRGGGCDVQDRWRAAQGYRDVQGGTHSVVTSTQEYLEAATAVEANDLEIGRTQQRLQALQKLGHELRAKKSDLRRKLLGQPEGK